MDNTKTPPTEVPRYQPGDEVLVKATVLRCDEEMVLQCIEIFNATFDVPDANGNTDKEFDVHHPVAMRAALEYFAQAAEPEPHTVCENSRGCIKCGKRIESCGGLCFACAAPEAALAAPAPLCTCTRSPGGGLTYTDQQCPHHGEMRKADPTPQEPEPNLYERINEWMTRFYGWARDGSHGNEAYYRDAASGLGIALQEIDRERYDREASRA